MRKKQEAEKMVVVSSHNHKKIGCFEKENRTKGEPDKDELL